MRKIVSCLLLLGMLIPPAAVAEEIALEIYSRPRATEFKAGDVEKSCNEIEQELSALIPLTYSNHESVYEDKASGAAMVVGSVANPMAYTYMTYPLLFAYVEKKDIAAVKQRVRALRELKAGKRCFEDY